MTKYFDSISSEDKEILAEAFINITLLIASSDNKLTQKEIDEAEYYFKVDFPRGGQSIKNTFTSGLSSWPRKAVATRSADRQRSLP